MQTYYYQLNAQFDLIWTAFEIIVNFIVNNVVALIIIINNFSFTNLYMYVGFLQIFCNFFLLYALFVNEGYAVFDAYFSFQGYPITKYVPYKFINVLDFIP